MIKNNKGEIIDIDTYDFIKILHRYRTDSRFPKSTLVNIIEGCWDTDDIKEAILFDINDNLDSNEYQDLISDLE